MLVLLLDYLYLAIVNLETQQEIVDKIEKTLKVHKDEGIMIERISNIDSIKQAILSKAFKGELILIDFKGGIFI